MEPATVRNPWGTEAKGRRMRQWLESGGQWRLPRFCGRCGRPMRTRDWLEPWWWRAFCWGATAGVVGAWLFTLVL